MAKRRRKDKHQDETLVNVMDVRNSAQDYFERNKVVVMGVLAAIVLLVGGFIIYKVFFKEPAEKQAKIAIYKAEQQFARDSFALALENPGGGFEGFLDIIENYGGTESANLAKLYSAISYLNLGRFEDAIEFYKSHDPENIYATILKNGGLGDAYSELGDYDQALSYYSKAAKAGVDDLLTPYYLYKEGLLAQKTDDNSRARKAFERIANEFPDSNEADNVNVLLVQLDNQ